MKQHRLATPGAETSASSLAAGGGLQEQELLGNAALRELVASESSAGAEQVQTDDTGIETVGGTWNALLHEPYEVPNGEGVSKGCSIELEFMPNGMVDAEQIALVQTCQAMVVEEPGGQASPYYLGDEERERRGTTAADGEAGWHIDSNGGDVHPVYGVDTHEEGSSLTEFGDPERVNHGHGRCELDAAGKNTVVREPAFLKDGPKLSWSTGKSFTMRFETAALCTAGAQQGTWYGSVKWGCEVDEKGTIKLEEVDVQEQGNPSDLFIKAVENFNEDTALVSTEDNPELAEDTKLATTDLPTAKRTLDPTDLKLQHRAIRVASLETFTELNRLQNERIRYVSIEKNRVMAKMDEDEKAAHLAELFDESIGACRARLVALQQQKKALASDD